MGSYDYRWSVLFATLCLAGAGCGGDGAGGSEESGTATAVDTPGSGEGDSVHGTDTEGEPGDTNRADSAGADPDPERGDVDSNGDADSDDASTDGERDSGGDLDRNSDGDQYLDAETGPNRNGDTAAGTGGEEDTASASDSDADTGADADGDVDDGTDSEVEGTDSEGGGTVVLYGEPHEGQYHLGPVDFAHTEWFNACAPIGGYREALRESTGLGSEALAGVSYTYADFGGVCDACIYIETGAGRTAYARVVTYGATNEPGDIDVSPSLTDVLDTGEWPRHMRWTFARCPDDSPLAYEFQTEASVWWTSLWVRNPRVPLLAVEVKSGNHPEYVALRRESDGTFNDDGGFGEGPFVLRLTAMDGQIIEEDFDGFSPGELVFSDQQFN